MQTVITKFEVYFKFAGIPAAVRTGVATITAVLVCSGAWHNLYMA